MNIYFIFYAKKAIATFLIWCFMYSILNLVFFNEYLDPLEKRQNSKKFYYTYVTEESHRLAVDKNYIGLTIQTMKEQMSGAIGCAMGVAAFATWEYRKKQKDLEAINRK